TISDSGAKSRVQDRGFVTQGFDEQRRGSGRLPAGGEHEAHKVSHLGKAHRQTCEVGILHDQGFWQDCEKPEVACEDFRWHRRAAFDLHCWKRETRCEEGPFPAVAKRRPADWSDPVLWLECRELDLAFIEKRMMCSDCHSERFMIERDEIQVGCALMRCHPPNEHVDLTAQQLLDQHVW